MSLILSVQFVFVSIILWNKIYQFIKMVSNRVPRTRMSAVCLCLQTCPHIFYFFGVCRHPCLCPRNSGFKCKFWIKATLQPPIRTTLCGHNFCEACLINASQGKPNWKCPECRRLHECPVEFYARNYLIEKLAGKIYAKNSNGVTVGRKQSEFQLIKLFYIKVVGKNVLI